MQAVCERALTESGNEDNPTERLVMSIEGIDYSHIQEVIQGSCDLLTKVVDLAEKDTLRFAPIRIFLRITTASVFLLKALSIGVRNNQLRAALNILDRSINALRSSVLDDMHLANRYTTLLDIHVKQLRKGFAQSSKHAGPTNPITRSQSMDPTQTGNGTNGETETELTEVAEIPAGTIVSLDNFNAFDVSFDDCFTDNSLLSLPFDPTMAPFESGYNTSFHVGLESNGLDFIWNLPS